MWLQFRTAFFTPLMNSRFSRYSTDAISRLIPHALVVAFAFTAFADAPDIDSKKTESFERQEGPELYIENLPSAERLQRAPVPASVAALGDTNVSMKGKTDGA